jgi:hypothetical protein
MKWKNRGVKRICRGVEPDYQAISKKPFGPTSLLEVKFKSLEY